MSRLNYLKNISLTVSHNSFRMADVYVLMCLICKICFTIYTGETKINGTYLLRVKSGNFGHQVFSDIHLQTVKIKMRRLLSRFLLLAQ